MAIPSSFLHRTHLFLSFNRRSVDEFVSRNMLPFVGYLRFFLCNFVIFVFGVFIRRIFRIQGDYGSEEMDVDSALTSKTDEASISISSQSTQKIEFVEERVHYKRKQEPETSVFQFVSPEVVSVSASNSSKCQLKPTIEIHGFIEESEPVNCLVEELYVSTDGSPSSGNQTPGIGFSRGKYLWEFSSEAEETEENDDERQIEEFIEKFSTGDVSQKGDVSGSENTDQILDAEVADEVQTEPRIARIVEKQNEDDLISNEGEILTLKNTISNGFESFPEVQVVGEDFSFSSSDSDSESTSSDNGYFESNHRVISGAISDDIDDGRVMELETPVAIEGDREEADEEICFSDDRDSEKVDNIKEKFYISEDDEYIELELRLPVSTVSYAKVLPVNDSIDDGYEMENSIRGETENEDSSGESDEIDWQEKQLKFEEDYEDEIEFLKEHQDLIEQLKMELRNARTGGLPTIQEEEPEPESVSPELAQGLKPLKNNSNSEYKQQLKEIQKVYKIYAEKMRKLDVLNCQTIHAIGFLKLKGSPVSPTIEGRKSPIRAVKSMIFQNLWSRKAQKPPADGAPGFVKDLNRDLELVYVGHLCLSWEILHWQHRKAMQLQENDSQGTHKYNQVANKFQLFCVLVQRFIEDERFHGPRIENYVKNRCAIRSLLQVPAIREDCSNDKRLRGREGENTISTRALVPIIEDAMRVFWEFLRTDGNSVVKGAQQLHQTGLQNLADAQLMMMDIRAGLSKKEKRLKDILRSGNCIVKKFQREEKGRLNNGLFIAQVELKLVSKVLSMSKLTESQLIWCHKKLQQVNFVNRKVVIEPSFLLFPC